MHFLTQPSISPTRTCFVSARYHQQLFTCIGYYALSTGLIPMPSHTVITVPSSAAPAVAAWLVAHGWRRR